MEEYKPNFKHFIATLVLTLVFSPSITQLQSQDLKLTPKEARILKETFHYIESIEPKKLKIDKKTYTRYSNFESIFRFPFSGKKVSIWLQSRIKSYSSGATGEFIAYYQNGEVYLGKQFFSLNKFDRFLVLLHEARHADGKDFAHINCPSNYPYLNPRDLKISPANKKGCDTRDDGGYGITASLIFEMGAFGFLSQTETAYRYNTELARIIKD